MTSSPPTADRPSMEQRSGRAGPAEALRPLSGMTVVDISQQLPGPYASALLASYGADVLKVEPPAGDPSRSIDPAMFELVNSDKTCVRLDLKKAGGVSELHRLLRAADVFIEGFRPGVAERLGAGLELLSSINPGLVYCSISGTGQEGPLARLPVHDLNLQGLAGLRGGGDAIGVPWVDLGTATMAAFAIAAAWHRSVLTGVGCFIDAAMLDTSVLWGRVKADANERAEPTYGIFATADGLEVAVAVLEDHIWPRLCAAFGWDEWSDARELSTYAGRVVVAGKIRERLESACNSRSLRNLVDLALEHDLPLTPAGAGVGAEAEEQLATRELCPESDRAVPTPFVRSFDKVSS